MSFFQNSVINKYLAAIDKQAVDALYIKFKEYFHNPDRQQNIREAKEEQFQEGFLRELFVNILRYTLYPEPAHNLTTEYKNIKDSKKADGAIIIDGAVKGVIELKGTDTTDLSKIENQAFGYKNNQQECVYVITSNFEKIRFYIDNAIEYLEFNLFTLTDTEFELLWLCLAYCNVQQNIPQRIKDESISQEDEITKILYKDYSLFKRELHQNLVRLNPQYDALTLFKKSQKLLDRFLFLFFAEDRLLLPPNSVRLVLNDWRDLQERDVEIPLYDRFKKYFEYLNTGYKGKRYDVYAYNGGLFKPDKILDTINIDDELLFEHTKNLSEYDFASEIDVNILGHIFENSLNELDEIKAQLEGLEIDKSKTKRKKDGVFYTPKYITKYIVESTLGRLCDEKKAELQIKDEDYTTDKRRQIKTKQVFVDKLTGYRTWLLQLTVCDPACGSGAFLNQALDFLINEHRYIDELQAKLFGDALVFSDLNKSILENNLFGVDLNEESVEIAKLSLWLRTAQPNRKLNDLSNNIKCGNSLIDDPAVARDKAFNWHEAFSQVFEKGGFDVVIGNPPYVQSTALNESTKQAIYKKYKSAEYQINTYGVFIEKTFDLLKDNSLYGLIIPNYWLSTKYDAILRNIVFNRNEVLEIINLYQVFEDANVDTLLITGMKTTNPVFPKESDIKTISNQIKTIGERLIALNLGNWEYCEKIGINDINQIIQVSFQKRIKLNGKQTAGDLLEGYMGMKPYEKGKGIPTQTREMMNGKIYHSDTKIDDSYYPLIGAGHVQRYLIRPTKEYIKYGKNLAAPRKFEIFTRPRILINRILSKEKIDAVYTEETLINNTDVFNFLLQKDSDINLHVLLAILGIKLCASFFRSTNVNLDRTAFPKLNVNNLLSFPLPDKLVDADQQLLIEKAVLMISLNKELQEISQKFQRTLQRKFELQDLSNKLQDWYLLSYGEFIRELAKKKTKISLSEEAEWEGYFLQESQNAQKIKARTDTTDKEIDHLVYDLYGLTEEEIKIVENG
ncbi:MAG: N-6 DNA methylase [Bacteroidales bacterium]|nr:N-6 DNA methylase [Bacteroidales bacterium]